jgi:subtilisin-like proprotein convertase family protein
MKSLVTSICLFLLLAGSQIKAQTFVGTGGNIPDNGPAVRFPLTVSGLPNSIDSSFGLINVCINITHTYDSDLEIWLIAPDSTYIELSTDNGGSGNNFTNTCFYDTVSNSIKNGSAPFNGSYRPESPINIVNNSQDPNAVWQLWVRDDGPTDIGTVLNWSITFGNNPPPAFLVTSSNLPIIKINTYAIPISDDPKIIANMQIIDNGPGIRNYVSDPATMYNGNIGIELRGSSSQGFPKKSFGLETWDALGNDLDTSLFGMPSESDWILNASYTDKSFMRNVLSYDLSQKMGHYSSRFQYCELFLNGQYQGIYIFLEKIKRDNGRVNIAKMTPADTTGDDLTGGYILKVDKTTGSSGGGWNSLYNPTTSTIKPLIQVEYPDINDILPVQAAYIKAVHDSFEIALNGPNFTNPATGYRRFIDVASWIDYFIVCELSKNVDAYRISTYYHKDKNSNGGLMKMGPVWDYDIAWGNADYNGGDVTSGYAYQFNSPSAGQQVPFWWNRLIQDPYFKNNLRCRWNNLRTNLLSTANLYNWIDSIGVILDESQARNFVQWPILGVYVWPNPLPLPTTYSGVKQELKNWIVTRAAWLDMNLPGICNMTGLENTELVRTNLIAYPNPATESTWLLLPEKLTGLLQLNFYNELGQLISSENISVQDKELYIDVQHLKPGMHFIELRQGKEIYRAKLMVR